jgi:hypothetical protein
MSTSTTPALQSRAPASATRSRNCCGRAVRDAAGQNWEFPRHSCPAQSCVHARLEIGARGGRGVTWTTRWPTSGSRRRRSL